MVRSISDSPLYRCGADKDMYLRLIKKYQGVYLFNVYAYCIMDNHAHIIIDGLGADISKIMHGINQCYAQYYNKKYNRRGHLFQDRFKSKIITDDRYLLTLSAYIHNNPSDIKGFKDREEDYIYSSLGVYIGLMNDDFKILDTSFILNQFGKNSLSARKKYREFVRMHREEEQQTCDTEFTHEKTEYRSERKPIIRNVTPCEVIEFVSAYTKQNKSMINIKYIKKCTEFKALSALLMRGLCDMKQKDICSEMGNITQSHAARLCTRGLDLINERDEYRNIISDFLEK